MAKPSLKIRYFLLPFTALAIAVPTIMGAGRISHESALLRQLNTFNTIARQLEDNYVDSIQSDRVFDTAIRALLSEIDPYTEYFTEEESKAFKTSTTGEYAGIGSYIMERDSSVYFSGPYEGSPAALAGLRSGDRIVLIDTIDVSHAKSERVSKLLRGQADSNVHIKVERPYVGEDSILEFDITRKKLHLPSVPYHGITADNIGYIKLTSFMQTSADEVRKALEEFKNNPELKGVVLDLRGNGGGLVQSAVEIVGNFVPKGTEVLRTKWRDKSESKVYRTTRNPIMPDLPLAILIDGASASASEITAGALQDMDRAVLIGSRSFGKGLVQSTFSLPYGRMLKLTTAKYYIPSGRLIQALDYSRRNPDGTVAHTPDSLCNTFTTKHGRPVKDGGGLKPDVDIDWGKVSPLVINLVRDFWIFDYATKFVATHPSIPSPQEFEITDEIFDDFKQSIDSNRLKYDKVCEDMLDSLEKAAEREGYMNDSTKAEFAVMRELLTHNLNKDLDTNRKEISSYLASEILGRYYYDRGEIIHSMKDDEALDKAVELLTDPKALKELGIVLPPVKK